MAAKLAALVTLLGLLGSVACQAGYSSSDRAPGLSSSPSDSNSHPTTPSPRPSSLHCILRGWIPFLPPCETKTPSPDLPVPSLSPPPPSGYQLSEDHYNKTDSYCPDAEGIVRNVVEKAIYNDPGIGAGLIRLFFHDCFVRGCDASVLLKNTTGSSEETEMFGLPNINSLRGFEVIDAAKSATNDSCGNKVSCADIVAFAAREAARILSKGVINIRMPAGRLDGRVSLKQEAEQNLPGPFDDLEELTRSFDAQGLDVPDMVALSGAHSIGRARCRFFENRLPPNPSDMEPRFASDLAGECKNAPDKHVMQDNVTATVLDSQYYDNVRSGTVLFTSDDALNSTDDSRKLVNRFAVNDKFEWERAFEAAMVRMGDINVKTTKPDGEIREKCWIYNSNN